MKIEYKILEPYPNVIAIIVPDQYQLGMLFCRVSEYYECPNEIFRGQEFDIWDFMEWQRLESGFFDYPKRWHGYNLPFKSATKCYEGRFLRTPYDNLFIDILNYHNKDGMFNNGYIIGATSAKGSTFKHELCHALYYTNREYKILADEITKSIDWQDYLIFEDNLLSLCYTASVINDEIQAYMMTNYKAKYFSKGVDIDTLNELHKKYKEQLNKFLE